MQFKTDENLHSEASDLLRRHKHDACTVYEQGLQGHADSDVAEVCLQESRTLVTLDLDFSDIRAYPPNQYCGIIVLRLADQSRPAVLRMLQRIIPLFETEPLVGHLWIVDEHQVRVRSSSMGSD
jgi:predicted nuclease of predicted toxin-antitoxin system